MRKNPDTTTYLLLGVVAVGLYMAFKGSQGMAGLRKKAPVKKSPARYVRQYFGKGPDRDSVCYDTVARAYVDDLVCEGYTEKFAAKKALEGYRR